MSQPVQEEDRIATGKIVAVAFVSLVVFGIGAVWAVSIQRSESKSIVTALNPAGPAEAGAPEVGIVYQWPFNISQYGEVKKAALEARLHSYGWTDKNAKIAHIPIDVAMQKYVAQSGGQK